MKKRTSSVTRTVYAVTLGCPKNRVDTEVMLGDLLSSGYALVDEPEDADVVLVNTCGFLSSARQESIEMLSDMAASLKPGARLVAAGCMVEKFGRELTDAVPGIHLMTGTRDFLGLSQRLLGLSPDACGNPTSVNPRLVTTGGYAYLKVADGCNRRCSYCIIPAIKGRQHSRTVDDLLVEAAGLASTGVSELILIAQDLTHYGSDLAPGNDLARLIRGLENVPGIDWVRLMYLYPSDIDDALLDTIASTRNCLPYLDMPVQHADDAVLARMRRSTRNRDLVRLVDRIRRRIPGVMLRTTLMTGFPGETPEAFENLISFAKYAAFDLVGVFQFSPEPGSAAAKLPDQVPAPVGLERKLRLESVLSEIAAHKRAALVGQTMDACAEYVDEDGSVVGRMWFQAPEVDGKTVIEGLGGEDQARGPVVITSYCDADFVARKV
jgi:ribosomal protein S12 methylthiotransferase